MFSEKVIIIISNLRPWCHRLWSTVHLPSINIVDSWKRSHLRQIEKSICNMKTNRGALSLFLTVGPDTV